MSKFTDKHKNDLKLLFDSKVKQVREQLPTLADAFEKRIREDLQRPTSLAVDKIDAVKTSGRYTDERAELRLYTHGFMDEKLTALRTSTVDTLEADRAKREAALLAPKSSPKDPAMALVLELQRQEVRRELRALSPLDLQVRLKTVAATEAGTRLLDAIESDPVVAAGGSPMVGADLLRDTRAAMALAADPQIGELAMLRDAYQFCIGAAEQVVLEASGLSKLEIGTDPAPPARDTRPPYRVSTGEPVTT